MSNETETRLKIAEMRLEEHGKLHEETSAAIKEMTAAVTKLVQAEIRREQDVQTFERIFKEMEKIRKDVEEHKKDFEEYKDKQTEKELDAYKGIVWKTVRWSLVIVASMFVGHFGGHWLG